MANGSQASILEWKTLSGPKRPRSKTSELRWERALAGGCGLCHFSGNRVNRERPASSFMQGSGCPAWHLNEANPKITPEVGD
jgi:hypothetical protein